MPWIVDRTPLCFGRHLHMQSLAPTNPHWAVVGYGSFPLLVIHKEGLCPSSGDNNRLMLMMTKICRHPVIIICAFALVAIYLGLAIRSSFFILLSIVITSFTSISYILFHTVKSFLFIHITLLVSWFHSLHHKCQKITKILFLRIM
jgi:hypothetical protein